MNENQREIEKNRREWNYEKIKINQQNGKV